MKIFIEFRKNDNNINQMPTIPHEIFVRPQTTKGTSNERKKQQLPILLKREMINHNPLKINDNQNS